MPHSDCVCYAVPNLILILFLAHLFFLTMRGKET